ncbi:MAG TPA: hypothetical protein VKU82_08650 [Planctomycetaceae bacterium]|nr:hypothetical protein [Planctomycetaceae bacterium]
MSCLKLHWPQTLSLYAPVDADWQSDSDEAPVILPFARSAAKIGRTRERDLLARARLIHENRNCPECGRASAVPVDAQPALMFRNHMPVPGSGTLVGFACDCCGHEWDA